MKTKTFFIAMFIFGFFLLVIYLGAFLKACSREDEIYVYSGDAGYTQYTNTSNGTSVLLNISSKPYYVATITNVTNYSFFEYSFLLKHDSFVSKEIQVNPGDTLILKKDEEITHRWKGIDECGHEIPFNNIEYVGYWKDGEFNRKE
jgi:hypothetical protein